MANPVTVEVTRGSLVESSASRRSRCRRWRWKARVLGRRHRCRRLSAFGVREAHAGVAARRKRRSGRLWLRQPRLALACSSHNGEDEHVALASSMLARAGRAVEALECGAHWSSSQKTLIHQARTMDKPTALRNNCSGKHAGFVCACCPRDIDPKGYVGYDHLQTEIRGTMESLTGAVLGKDNCGTDGCSIPTYAVRLRGLAHGFAKWRPERASIRSVPRPRDGCSMPAWPNPSTSPERPRLHGADADRPRPIFAKTGAEGVFCAAIPEQGIAIAVKCDDGHSRAAEAMVAATLSRFFERDTAIRSALSDMATVRMRNWNGIHVGDITRHGCAGRLGRFGTVHLRRQRQKSLMYTKLQTARTSAVFRAALPSASTSNAMRAGYVCRPLSVVDADRNGDLSVL